MADVLEDKYLRLRDEHRVLKQRSNEQAELIKRCVRPRRLTAADSRVRGAAPPPAGSKPTSWNGRKQCVVADWHGRLA